MYYCMGECPKTLSGTLGYDSNWILIVYVQLMGLPLLLLLLLLLYLRAGR